MKIIAINGSPRGKQSTTYLMVEEFLQGAKQEKANCRHILLSELTIHPCTGCFTCWAKTPSRCIFQDDLQSIDLSNADLILYASPLYRDNITGILKNFLDRSTSKANPLMAFDESGEAVHPKRKQTPAKLIAMSCCGFPGQTHFEPLKLLFRRMARNSQTDLIGEIYRDEGPLLQSKDPKHQKLIAAYKNLLQKAGSEIALNGKISEETQQMLESPLIPYEEYIERHNAFFHRLLSQTAFADCLRGRLVKNRSVLKVNSNAPANLPSSNIFRATVF